MATVIEKFVMYSTEHLYYPAVDRIYLTNCLFDLVGETDLANEKHSGEPTAEVLLLLDDLVAQAVQNEKIEDLQSARDILTAKIMDLLTPLPSQVNAQFQQLYQKSPRLATDYFFELSQQNDYIKTRAIAKNIAFKTASDFGELEITINLSKPEKDPKQIALERDLPKADYPKCLLCMENEGYTGRGNYPARRNHRIIRLQLGTEDWGLQYSPYAYFNEHCIFLSAIHRPMSISPTTFQHLVEIVDQFPEYFVGSNADLPIVGGSILAHDHFQGGRYDFPMAKAPLQEKFVLSDFPEVQAGIVKWPMSVIRLQTASSTALVAAASFILEKWRNYSDPSVLIQAFSGTTPHHTITPIVRKKNEFFEMDLVLRDNQTSAEFPDGIFHPHADVQHIKKENIGLIEVMGLAILPARLKTELAEVERYLLAETNEIATYHLKWAQEIKQKYSNIQPQNVTEIIQTEVGTVFARVLADAGVYKQDAVGQAAFRRFTKIL